MVEKGGSGVEETSEAGEREARYQGKRIRDGGLSYRRSMEVERGKERSVADEREREVRDKEEFRN